MSTDELCLALHLLFGHLAEPETQRDNSTLDEIPEIDVTDDVTVTGFLLQMQDVGVVSDTGSDTTLGLLDQGGSSTDVEHMDMVKNYMISVVNPSLCIFGLLGNILNVFVLTHGRIKVTLGCSMERSAHTGLVALAVSDMLYCATAFCDGLLNRRQTAFESLPGLYVQIYGPYLQNVFLHTGAWLTVIMAAGRYAAICRPLQARCLVNTRVMRTAVLSSFVVWIVLDLPRIWTYEIVSIDCIRPEFTYHILDHGQLVLNDRFKMALTYIWAILGFLLPVVTLSYCNFYLVKALRESLRTRRMYCVSPKSGQASKSGARISPTLIAIVFMYLILVSPSEILHFWYYTIGKEDVEQFNLAITVTNLLQTLNFAANFVLYCIVNVHFREACMELMLGRCSSRRGMVASRQRSSFRRHYWASSSTSQNTMTRGMSLIGRRASVVETTL